MNKLSRLSLSLGLIGVFVAACGTTLELNTENLQGILETQIEEQNVERGIDVTSVTCPERPILQGDIFTCQAMTADGQNLIVSVTQTDDQGNVNWEITGSQ